MERCGGPVSDMNGLPQTADAGRNESLKKFKRKKRAVASPFHQKIILFRMSV
jgi:hypothetical protein